MSEENLPAEFTKPPSQLLIADASPEDAARIERRIRAYLREDIWSVEALRAAEEIPADGRFLTSLAQVQLAANGNVTAT